MMSQSTMFADLEQSNFHFPDLKKKVEHNFCLAQMAPDLENFIKSLNRLGKSLELSEDQKNYLIKFRQKAYDRKRAIKTNSGNPRKSVNLEKSGNLEKSEKSEKSVVFINENPSINSIVIEKSGNICTPENLQISGKSGNSGKTEISQNLDKSVKMLFWNGVKSGLKKIDGEKFITKLPAFLINACMTTLVSYLVWSQSFDLYKSSGFVSPGLCATGGVIMVLVFAAQYTVNKSWFALFLCLYIGGYEAYFMVTATLKDETILLNEQIEKGDEITFLTEKMNKNKDEYLMQKARYEDPKSKLYKNDWFKKNYLQVAWKENELATKMLITKKELLKATEKSENIILLKILYRLGIVLLAMILIHQLVSIIINPITENS